MQSCYWWFYQRNSFL